MAVEKSLTERFVNLYQVPHELETSFGSEVVRTTQEDFLDAQIQPVRPNAVTYMPMTMQLLPPKVDIDVYNINEYNLELKGTENDPDSVGSNLVGSDDILEAASDFDLVFQTLEFVPELVFYINPTDLQRQYQRRLTTQFGGDGHITEHWGEEQDVLSATGRIGAMYTNKTGLTRYFRRDSASYQQLMQMYLMYRNNGYIYEVTDTRRISLVGRIQISYDTEVWVGHFDTFSMTEAADNPFTMEYNFQFTVREYFNDESLR